MSEQRKYRTFTAQQKIEIVLAGLRGDRTIKEVCRDHQIAEALYYTWRDKLLEGGRAQRSPAKRSARARRS
jgi:transposase